MRTNPRAKQKFPEFGASVVVSSTTVPKRELGMSRPIANKLPGLA